MDTWQGPMSGWQELAGSWALLAAVALLLLAAVTANALADTHPVLGRRRDAAARAAGRAAARLWAFAAPRAEAALRWVAEVTDRSLVAVRRVIDERRSAGGSPGAPEAAAHRAGPTTATP
jgi:hypothetical protein